MYKLKSNRFKIKFVTSKSIMIFGNQQEMAEPGDVIVHFSDSLARLFSKDEFLKIAEEAEIERKPKKKGKKNVRFG